MTIDVYPYASSLWDELDRLGIIERLKAIPQLGVIKVPKQLNKSRYDYVLLQLHFHQIIGKRLKQRLKLTYGNEINEAEFPAEFSYEGYNCPKKPSIADILQLLTIIYNIGHFSNTFVASRAAIMLAKENPQFRALIVNAVGDERYKEIADKIIEDENYHRFHLLNSLLILEQCDASIFSVQLSKEIIYAYLMPDRLLEDSKLHYVFRLFQSVRNVSFMAYDLQIAKVPITIDLSNDEYMTALFGEFLSEYNDKSSIRQLIASVGKLLDDLVYNESSNAICYFLISKEIFQTVNKAVELPSHNYLEDYFICGDSPFNVKYRHHKQYDENGILKLTFANSERRYAARLLKELGHMNCVCAGYYDRSKGERTIVASIKNSCHNDGAVSMRVLKTVIRHLREIPGVQVDDTRYLLAVKFFLFYYLGHRTIRIKETIDNSRCVLCTRGKRQKISVVQDILSNGYGTEDQRHEAEHLKYCLSLDQTNDTTISIPASIIVYESVCSDKMLCEFDGLIMYPNRDTNNELKQIVFLESKNMKEAGKAKKCLCKKLNKLGIEYNPKDIVQHDQDVYLTLSI